MRRGLPTLRSSSYRIASKIFYANNSLYLILKCIKLYLYLNYCCLFRFYTVQKTLVHCTFFRMPWLSGIGLTCDTESVQQHTYSLHQMGMKRSGLFALWVIQIVKRYWAERATSQIGKGNNPARTWGNCVYLGMRPRLGPNFSLIVRLNPTRSDWLARCSFLPGNQ